MLTITDEIEQLRRDVSDMEAAIPLAMDRIAFLSEKQRNLAASFNEWVDSMQADDLTSWSPGEMVDVMMETVAILPDEVMTVQRMANMWLCAQDLGREVHPPISNVAVVPTQ